jgi:hypothetical protein
VDFKNKMMRHIRTVGVIGSIPETFRKYLSNKPGMNDIKELKKRAVLGTAQLLRKVIMQKNKTFRMRSNILCITHCNHRIAAKPCVR